jgi:SMI1 / KNR4 family (SUKH-1)
MDAAEWGPWLAAWAAEMQANADDVADDETLIASGLDPKRVHSGSFANPPPSEAAIVALEQRLGASLPRSYREFLRASDGFAMPTAQPYPLRLLGVLEVDWLRNTRPEAIEAWTGETESVIPDEVYFQYGPGQDPINMRTSYLHGALQISTQEVGGTAVCLLNPAIVHNGEWEAWVWAHWFPGAYRYRSFAELLISTRAG